MQCVGRYEHSIVYVCVSSAGCTRTTADCVSREEMNAINKELQAVKDKLSARENNSGRLYLLDNPGELTCKHSHLSADDRGLGSNMSWNTYTMSEASERYDKWGCACERRSRCIISRVPADTYAAL